MLALEEERRRWATLVFPAYLGWSFIAWLLLEIEAKEVQKSKKEKPILIVNYKGFLEFFFFHLRKKRSNSCDFVLQGSFLLLPRSSYYYSGGKDNQG